MIRPWLIITRPLPWIAQWENTMSTGEQRMHLKGQLQLALNDFDRGLLLDPKHANGYKNRSLVYQSFQQWDKAIDDISIYLEMHPEDADLWYERGRLKNILTNFPTPSPILTGQYN